MKGDGEASEIFLVDDLIIDTGLQSVSRGDNAIPLPNLSFKLLLALVRAAPNFLTNEALMERVWPGLVVNSETVSKRVALLRDALGDDSREPRYIAGLRSRGYRLLVPVTSGTRPQLPSDLPIAIPTAEQPSAREALIDTPIVQTTKPHTMTRRLIWWLAGAVCVSLLIAFLAVKFHSPSNGASIAVMPFDSISADPGDAYLAVGIPEMLLDRIASVHEFTVIARGSSFASANKGLDPREIGKRLGTAYVLEGSVQRDGNSLRVAVQLIEAASNKMLWSERFDRHLTDIFRVEDEVGDQVTSVLLGHIGRTQVKPQPLLKDRSANIESYLAFLRGRAALGRFTIADSDAAVRELERSVELDPQFAAAYASLYDARMQAADKRYQDLAPIRAQYQPLIDRALQLDPGSGAAYFARAMWATDGTDANAREADFARGAELDPSNGRGLTAYAEFLRWDGDVERRQEAARMLQRALRIDPVSPRAHFFEAILSLDDYGPEVVQQKMLEVLELDPNFVPALQRYGKYQWQHGELASGVQIEEHAIALDPANPWTRHTAMAIYLDLGDIDAARAVAADTAQSALGAQVLTSLWRGDWRAAGLAASPGQPSWKYGVIENWGASEALRDYALKTGQSDSALNFFKMQYHLSASPPYGLALDNFRQALYASQLAAALGRAGEATDLRQASAQWNDANQVKYGPLYARRLRASIFLLDRQEDAALKELAESFKSADYVQWWYALKYDPLWIPFHNDPRFQAVVRDVEQYVAIQRHKLESLREKGLVPRRTGPPPVS